MASLILFRGLPGSGKSSAAQCLCDVVLSADDFFLCPSQNGWEYRFDGSRIRDAHAQCIKNTEAAIRLGIAKIGVANTFTQGWELAPYYALGKQCGIQVTSLIVENRHGSNNSHGVPSDVIQVMRSRFEVQL
jgi:predicted kinase